MTLKNIPLPPIVLSNLYKYSLIEPLNNKKKVVQQYPDIVFFGGNKRHILLLVNNVATEYLADNQLIFLSTALTTCKMSINDIAIVNLNETEVLTHRDIPDLLKAKIVIASGVDNSVLELPFKIPQFQVQLYKDKKYVFIPSLQIIQHDPVLKPKLPELLKMLFPE